MPPDYPVILTRSVEPLPVLLRKAGVDTMTIKDLGRWEILEMVQRYTRSVGFQDSLRFYKAPLSGATLQDPMGRWHETLFGAVR